MTEGVVTEFEKYLTRPVVIPEEEFKTLVWLMDANKGLMISAGIVINHKLDVKLILPEQTCYPHWVEMNPTAPCRDFFGNDYPNYPPKGWRHAGGILSHGTMMPFWSATTDKTEQRWPGTYICVGNFTSHPERHEVPHYQMVVSVMDADGKRRMVTPESVLNLKRRRCAESTSFKTSCRATAPFAEEAMQAEFDGHLLNRITAPFNKTPLSNIPRMEESRVNHSD